MAGYSEFGGGGNDLPPPPEATVTREKTSGRMLRAGYKNGTADIELPHDPRVWTGEDDNPPT